VNVALPVQGTVACPSLTTGSNCIRSVPFGNAEAFQSAINAATCGDTIILAAGSTYSGNFTIPATSCTSNSGWIEIVSSGVAGLPASGNRVSPSNAANMPTISTPNVSPALAFLPGSNHWRIIGCEITTSYAGSNTLYWLIGMGLQSDNSTWVTTIAQLPAFIILDRTYVYGSPVTPIQHGIYANTQAFALVDSYCDEIVDSGADAQCVVSVNGNGPFLIQNNFLQASGENILFGGADPAIKNLIPSDIAIIGNLIQKNTAWRGLVSDVKNLLELKNAQRVLVDGNVMQYTWTGAQYEAIIYRSVNQSGACTWCSVLDVTTTHNIISHAPVALVLAPIQGPVSTNDSVPTGRVLFQNNLITDIDKNTWGGGYYGYVFIIDTNDPPNMHDVILDHNTAFVDNAAMDLNYTNSGDQVTNAQLTNNLLDQGTGGYVSQAGAPVSSFFNGTYIFNDMALLNSTRTSAGYPSGYPGYPRSGTLFSSLSTVGFTSYSGTDPNLNGNFQLTSGSAFHNAGTDGRDIGVWDWTCLNNDTAAALTGSFVPGPGGCAVGANLQLEPPTNLNAEVQ
jgi:hypothetical protein